jgi:hypothetical protein
MIIWGQEPTHYPAKAKGGSMSQNILCLLGIHKWHILLKTTYSQLAEDMERQYYLRKWRKQHPLCLAPRWGEKRITRITEVYSWPMLYKRVCLRCHKYEDRITPTCKYLKQYIAKREAEIERALPAQYLK